MFGYAVRRLLGAIPTLFLIITIAFFLMRADKDEEVSISLHPGIVRTWDVGVWRRGGHAQVPYLAMDEQRTKRLTPPAAAAETTPLVAVTTFRVTRCGLNTERPS